MPFFRRSSGSRMQSPGGIRRKAGLATSSRYSRHHWIVILALLVGLFISLSGFSTALAASSSSSPSAFKVLHEHIDHIHPKRVINPQTTTCTTLCWYGGAVQHHPKVYLIFWGSGWLGDQYSVIPAMVNLFRNLGGGNYNNILAQYTNSSDFVHNDTILENTSQGTPYYIDSTAPVPSNLSTPQVGQEAASGLTKAGGVSDADTQVIVFPAPGSTYYDSSSFCGYHAVGSALVGGSPVNVIYGLVRFMAPTSIDPGDTPGCPLTGTNPITNQTYTIADSMTMAASHEYAETATDPQADNSGWSQGGPGSGETEIGDLCNREADSYTSVSGVSSTIQDLWSNANNGYNIGCMDFMGAQYSSPAIPYQHTVQGVIWNAYASAGGPSGSLGSPLTEETSIAGGRVSYFNGGCVGNTRCVGIYWKSGLPAAYWVRAAAFQEYQSIHESTSGVGFPIANEVAMNGGSVQYFDGTCAVTTQCAGIYWSSGSGAHYVRNLEFNEYKALQEANGSLGFPVTDDATIAGGSVTYFNGGCGGTSQCAGIYWSSGSNTHFVRNLEFNEYRAYQEANGFLGFPVTDDATIAGGSVTYFNGGCGGTNQCAGIYWSSGSGTHFVRSLEFNKYRALQEANGPLGFPVSDDAAIAGGSVTYFTGNHGCGTPGPSSSDGAIYWSSASGTYAVYGCIYATYITYGGGGPGGPLGFPTSDEYTNAAGYRESVFQHGTITWVNGQAQICLGVTC